MQLPQRFEDNLLTVPVEPMMAVVQRAGISPGRVSQIQTEIERMPLDPRLKKIIEDYKVKP